MSNSPTPFIHSSHRTHMPQGFVYILGSDTGTLYIGVTARLDARILQHKNGDGSQFTAKYGSTGCCTTKLLTTYAMPSAARNL